MDAIKVLLAAAFLSVLDDYVNSEAVCRKDNDGDDIICEPIDLDKGIAGCDEDVVVRRGNLDIILAVPHGGICTQFPYINRTHGCHDGTKCAYNHDCYVDSNPPDPTQCKDDSCCLSGENVKSDFKSNEVAYRIYNYILEKTGKCPGIIVSMPHRKYLEVNRYDADGLATFGEEEMEKIYERYHDNLTALVADLNGRPGILFDLHGHAQLDDWTMIGCMISALDLDENPPLDSLADESSIKLLLTRTGKTLTELLTGQNSLGKYIEDGIVNGVTLEAVPSDMNPDANGHTYFAAKDSPITNGHRDNINVLQIEMPSSGRKDYQSDYSNALGEAFLKFYGRYIDGCVRYPCGGTNSCSNEGGDYLCTCSNTNACPATTCTGAAAATGALHVDLSPNKANYNDGECILYTCKDGYEFSGSLSRLCEGGSWSGTAPICTDINECLVSTTCKNGATCQDLDGDFSCDCTPGYSGKDCGTDIDPCDPDPCGDHGSCTEVNSATFKCNCDKRYTGDTCESLIPSDTCYDYNWAERGYAKAINVNPLDKRNGWKHVCVNIAHKWYGDHCSGCSPKCCDDVDECKYNPCADGCECKNKLFDFVCVFHSGEICTFYQWVVEIPLIKELGTAVNAVIDAACSVFPICKPLSKLFRNLYRRSISNDKSEERVLQLFIGTDGASSPSETVQENLNREGFTDITVSGAQQLNGHCDKGQYRDGGTCFNCSAGTFSDNTLGIECTACEFGFYQDEEGKPSCKPCEPGYFSSEEGSAVCLPCPAGHTSSEAASSCTRCGPGTIAEAEGQPTCTTCLAGTQPSTDFTQCQRCLAGTYSESGIECTTCPSGMVAQQGQPICTRCLAGTKPSSDFTQCKECSAGKFSLSGVVCLPCDSGTFSTPSSSSCTSCSAGYFPHSNKSGCGPCEPGTWSSSGDNECTPCKDGSVSGEVQSSCTKCDGGTEPNDQKSECQNCSAGSYSSNGVGCISCVSGTYSTPRSSSCTLCPAGYFPNPNQSGCNPCLPGNWSNSGDHECQPCEDGSVSSGGQPNCTKCDGGTEPNDLKSECQTCSAGQYSSNGIQCIQCAMGTYSTQGRSRCTPCQAGYFPNSTQSGCSPCLPGSWSSSGDYECKPCEDGKVSAGGLPTCTECNAGTAPNKEHSLCENCTSGFISTAGNATCSPCPRDWWSPPGSEICSECELGEMTLKDQSGCVQNIAFNKTTKQKGNNAESSPDEENPDRPGNAVNGDYYNTCSRTKKTKNPWWRVNLGGWFAVRTVVIMPTEYGADEPEENIGSSEESSKSENSNKQSVKESKKSGKKAGRKPKKGTKKTKPKKNKNKNSRG